MCNNYYNYNFDFDFDLFFLRHNICAKNSLSLLILSVFIMAAGVEFYSTQVGDTIFTIPARYQELKQLGHGAQGVVW